ncbi:Uncharacterised protein [Mycobacteroides abscessus subsp. abscessus]|nr:Uncharacterised protein [Mycobacteroides abscessus subsp. abscessus]
MPNIASRSLCRWRHHTTGRLTAITKTPMMRMTSSTASKLTVTKRPATTLMTLATAVGMVSQLMILTAEPAKAVSQPKPTPVIQDMRANVVREIATEPIDARANAVGVRRGGAPST